MLSDTEDEGEIAAVAVISDYYKFKKTPEMSYVDEL